MTAGKRGILLPVPYPTPLAPHHFYPGGGHDLCIQREWCSRHGRCLSPTLKYSNYEHLRHTKASVSERRDVSNPRRKRGLPYNVAVERHKTHARYRQIRQVRKRRRGQAGQRVKMSARTSTHIGANTCTEYTDIRLPCVAWLSLFPRILARLLFLRHGMRPGLLSTTRIERRQRVSTLYLVLSSTW